MACATSSLPVPDSPKISTRPLVGAISWICWRSAFIGMLSPTITLFGVSCFFKSRFSTRSFLASTAFFTRINVFSRESGFSRKSYAPSLVARTAVSMVPCPEIMMTSGGLSRSRIFSRVSSPSIPGSHMSRSTTSKRPLSRTSRHSSPLAASAAWWPSSSSTPFREERMPDSSSTISMLGMVNVSCRWNQLRGHRQFHHEPRAHRLVLLDPDGAAMVFHNPAYNRQAQARASFLGRKIWQEQPLLQLLCHPVAGVGDHDLDCLVAGHQRRRNLDLPQHRTLNRLCRIVYQVGQRSFDRFRVGHHLRQFRSQVGPHPDAVEPAVEHFQRALHDRVDAIRLRMGRREAGQGCELVHQAPYRFHRPLDCLSAAPDHPERCFIRLAASLQMSRDALCRKRDRSKRVLDFV